MSKTLGQRLADLNIEVGTAMTIDWEEARIQAAIAAMPIVADDGYNVRNEQHLIAKYAVQLADELIEELKKGGKDETAK